MTKHKHTPAPWTGEKVINICNCYQVGLSIGYLSTSSKERRDEGEANAKLIAAAPELLAAIEGLMKCFDDGVGEAWSAKELDAARAAIAKATA